MSRLAVFLAVVFGSACATPNARVPVGPAATQPVRTAELARPAASRYSEPPSAPPTDPFSSQIVAAVRAAAGKAGLSRVEPDGRIFEACVELAEEMPAEGMPPADKVDVAMQRQGLVEPSPNLIVMSGNLTSPQLLDDLAARFVSGADPELPLRFGVGRTKLGPDGTGTLVFASLASAITLQPVPRVVPAGGTIMLSGAIDFRYRQPEVVVTRDSGLTERVPVRVDLVAFVAEVSCGARLGRQQIELLATGTRGVRVLANFPVWCGAEPTTATVLGTGDDEPVTDPRAAERRMLALLNRDRAIAGLRPLVIDEHVAEVARAYSTEMRRTKIVAHVSSISGAADDRVRAAGIRTGLVLENIALTYGVGEAHRGLMNSPGHRANILSPQVTHVGIGVVLGERAGDRSELYTTQVFIRVPPKVDLAVGRTLIRRKIIAAKGEPVGDSAPLTEVAQQLADALAAGKSNQSAYAVIEPQLDRIAGFARVATTTVTTSDVESFDAAALAKSTRVDDVGIGIAQGVHAEIGPGAIFIVVMSGQRR